MNALNAIKETSNELLIIEIKSLKKRALVALQEPTAVEVFNITKNSHTLFGKTIHPSKSAFFARVGSEWLNVIDLELRFIVYKSSIDKFDESPFLDKTLPKEVLVAIKGEGKVELDKEPTSEEVEGVLEQTEDGVDPVSGEMIELESQEGEVVPIGDVDEITEQEEEIEKEKEEKMGDEKKESTEEESIDSDSTEVVVSPDASPEEIELSQIPQKGSENWNKLTPVEKAKMTKLRNALTKKING